MNSSFSVVIPTANRPEAVVEAIRCVLGQSLKPSEIIVVDNGVEALSLPSHPMVRLVRAKPNIGPGNARNMGAEVAVAEYVAFLDDDDSWLPNYLEEVARTIDETSADVVLGSLMRKFSNEAPIPYKLFPASIGEQRQVYYRNPGFGGQNLTIKRSVLLGLGGFDGSMPASEDRDLAARLLESSRHLVSCKSAIAILHDHEGPRARLRQVEGNLLFIKKHWRQMTMIERFKALSTVAKRWTSVRFGRSSYG